MSNASLCLKTSAAFAREADRAETAEARRAYRELQRLWAEMAALADRFDREHDGDAKARIYAMMAEVEAARQKVA